MSATETEGRPVDLEKFTPSPPSQRLDDKAATLEAELSARVAQFNKERFCYIFVVISLFNILAANHFSKASIIISLILSLLFLIGAGKWLDFPFIHERLDKWERLIYDACRGRLTGRKPPTIEPM